MPKLTKTAAGALIAAGALAAASPVAADEVERQRTRVAVADGRTGDVRIFGLRSGKRVARLRVAAPAALATLGDGRHLLATQGTADRVDAIDGGAWSVRHDDHFHHFAAGARLLPFRLRVPRPVHVVPHGREVAIFADGSGEAHAFAIADLKRRAAGGVRLATGAPHHGVAVPLGDRFVVSQAAPGAEEGALPNALTLRDDTGAVVGRIDGCPELHGEAAGATWAAFACEDGVLVVRPDGSSQKLAYPARTGVEQRAFTLHRDGAERSLVGDFGDRQLTVFDLAAATSRTVPVAADIASFAVDADSGAIVVLTTDGRLRRIDPESGRERAVRRVVSRAFTPAFDRPSPKLAVRDGRAAVSDPRTRRVTVLRLRGLRRSRTLRVPGRPTSVAFAGVRPTADPR